MYQQYVSEARTAEYQQQCQRQAMSERSLRANCRAQQEGGEPDGCVVEPFSAPWLRVLRRGLGWILSQKPIVRPP